MHVVCRGVSAGLASGVALCLQCRLSVGIIYYVCVCSLSLAVVECYSEQEVAGIVRQIMEALQVGVWMAWVPGSLPLRREPATKEARPMGDNTPSDA